MSEIKNKIILITGGASGIGKLLGLRLISLGAKKLIIWDINEENLDKTKKEFNDKGFQVDTYCVDLSNLEQIIKTAQRTISENSAIDILINNAGIVVGKYFADHSHSEIDQTISVNTTALMHVTLELLPLMLKNNSGHIVNVASAAGYVSNPKMSVYCASKWAVIGWSDSLRIEMKKLCKNILVTTVTPYYINTGMFRGVKSHPLLPILSPEKAVDIISNGILKNKVFIRMPFLIKITPLVKGLLPVKFFDFFVGKVLKVYKTMDDFQGHEK